MSEHRRRHDMARDATKDELPLAASTRPRRIGLAVVVAALLAVGIWLVLRRSALRNDHVASHLSSAETIDAISIPSTDAVALEARVKQLCSACHTFPPPDILPRFVWEKEVARMYELIGLEETLAGYPSMEDTLAYYQNRAPADIVIPAYPNDRALGPVAVRAVGIRPAGAPPTPAVSFMRWLPNRDGQAASLLVCDMRHGLVFQQRLDAREGPGRILGRVPHPAGVEIADLDGDGLDDLLVADLGSFVPEDHRRGQIVWLRRLTDGQYESIPLLERLGRVADVRAADIDADGDLDLAVAVFGWRNTGMIVLLENDGMFDDAGRPSFAPLILDARPGAIHVPIVDLDRDGRLDIVTVLAQHHESVIAYLNRGPGDFEPQLVFAAPHPDWGCAGIEVVDLDADGDLDVILVNGDTLDNSVLKTFHGVYWLENEGRFPFTLHTLAALPGAYAVRTADLDGDGDLDVVASSFLPQFTMAQSRRPLNLQSVIWMEQTARGRFQVHSLEALDCDHPSLEVGDVDGDGDIDVMAGNFTASPEQLGTIENWITLLENQRH